MKYHKIDSVYKRDNKGKFTDEISRPIFEALWDVPWYATEKIDGMNIRIFHDGKVYGRSDNAQFKPAQLEYLQQWANIFKDIDLPEEAILFGELFGKGIQKTGGRYSSEYKFAAFDLWTGKRWATLSEFETICEVKHIPRAPKSPKHPLSYWVKEFQNPSDIKWPQPSYKLTEDGGSLNDELFTGYLSLVAEDKTMIAEGVVLRPIVEIYDAYGQRVITKLKHKDFERVQN